MDFKRASALLTLAFAACAGGRQDFRPLKAGDVAPAYSSVTLKGDTVDLARLQGRAVLFNVWATWCIPCREEMPAIEQLHAVYADSGLAVVAVSVDEAGTDRDVGSFVETYGVHFTIARDPAKRVQRVFRTIGVPETFLLDRHGKIVRRWIGQFEPMSADSKKAVQEALRG